MDELENIKAVLKMSRAKKPPKDTDFLSTGSTMLNLAATGRSVGGFLKGCYHFLVGDSMTGKTWLSMSCMAEAAQRPDFKDYTFILDDIESGALMDVTRYFGRKFAKRLSAPPSGQASRSVEELYFNIDDAVEAGPCIYVVDSMDGLDSEDDDKQFEDEKKAHQEGKTTSGTYGTSKAKTNSRNLRRLMKKLEANGSILIIISQTRDNIGFGAQFNPKTRSGGKALRFYAHIEIWSSIVKTLTKTVRGKKRQIGVITKCAIKKNRFTGQLNTAEVPIYHSYGMDDIGSVVDYLVDEKHWKKNKVINAHDLEVKMPRDKLIQYIEANELEDVVREIAEEVWKDIVEAMSLKGRKKRYE